MDLLSNFKPKHFLKDYWQKKPLLIRQAYPNYNNPVSAKQLMNIAGKKTAEARIVLEKGGQHPWELRHGPFKSKDFQKLAVSHWTLLVQATNHWFPALQTLLEDFYFIPQWRIEDVMTSYAVKQGSVGPHVDNYDVFLLQAQGQREWRISKKPFLQDDFLPDHEVKILRKFVADQVLVLNPGDMLYLPPRFAHYGIALDDCITHSIGFRAPSVQEMLDDYCTHVLSLSDDQLRYADPDLGFSLAASGAIDAKALNKVVKLVRNELDDTVRIKRWFGQFITRNKYTDLLEQQDHIVITQQDLIKRIKQGEKLIKNPAARMAYVEIGKQVYLYVNGKEFMLSADLLFAARLLTAKNAVWLEGLPRAIKNRKFVDLLYGLINDGCYYFSS